MDTQEEKQKLLAVVVAADETDLKPNSQLPIAVAAARPAAERNWDGSLLQCFGSGDRHGLAAFASTFLCLPVVMVHNLKAAFPGKSTRKLLLLLGLALTMHFMYSSQVHHTHHICEPFGPHHPHPKPEPKHPDPPGKLADPESQAFLAGATFNPAFLPTEDLVAEPQLPESEGAASAEDMTEVSQDIGFTVMVNGKPIEMDEFESGANAQIMLAKNEALEGMNQLAAAGRKLLHKHHHDDDKERHEKKPKHDDDNEDDHDDDDDDDDDEDDDHHHHNHHHNKEEAPELLEELSETFESRTRDEHPPHHPKDEAERLGECMTARRNESILLMLRAICWASVMLYGLRMRRAMREQFNIRGSSCRDYLAWACCMPCAVCQETRTLMKNNVIDGVWHDPVIYISPDQQPAEQLMHPEPAKKLPV